MKNKAAERIAAAEIRRTMAAFAEPIPDDEVNEYELIRERIAHVAKHCRWLEISIGELERSEVTYGLVGEENTVLDEATHGGAAGTGTKRSTTTLTRRGAALHLYYQILAAESDKLVNYCAPP